MVACAAEPDDAGPEAGFGGGAIRTSVSGRGEIEFDADPLGCAPGMMQSVLTVSTFAGFSDFALFDRDALRLGALDGGLRLRAVADGPELVGGAFFRVFRGLESSPLVSCSTLPNFSMFGDPTRELLAVRGCERDNRGSMETCGCIAGEVRGLRL